MQFLQNSAHVELSEKVTNEPTGVGGDKMAEANMVIRSDGKDVQDSDLESEKVYLPP